MDLFVLHAQRIVDVVSGVTLRHELFLRMVDRVRLIPAREFVLAAEEFGSMQDRSLGGGEGDRDWSIAVCPHPIANRGEWHP